jgi:hypothetical protein
MTTARRRQPEYFAWNSMRNRCHNPNNPSYHNYGGRGIGVCDEWASYDQFLADVGRRPSEKHTLDRINNDGHYEPSNVRWATRSEQSRNRRVIRLLTYQDETRPLYEWAEALGINGSTIFTRLARGYSVEDAIFGKPYYASRFREVRTDRDNVTGVWL